jgi:[acyl-carrier-protein] S-malonyltransferase
MNYAVLFPGQGSQTIGMGADVFEQRPDLLGVSAEDTLGWSLERLVADGSEEELTRTDRAQPALYGIAYALWEAFASAVDHPPSAAAGHSLGEYTALAAARAMDFQTGLGLVAERGAAMQQCAEQVESGMAALLGADVDTAEALCHTRRDLGGKLWVANINAPGQVVVAGGAEDITWAVENGRDHGVRRVIPLKVAGAFHSPFMAAASQQLGAALADVSFATPEFAVYANVTAAPVEDIRTNLADQLISQVRFSETLLAMADAGVETFVHIGPGDVTATMAKRTVKGASVLVVSALSDIAAVVEELTVQ